MSGPTAEPSAPLVKKDKNRDVQLPLVGISIGDVNGIGPEVTIKALDDKRMLGMMTPVVFASAKVMSFYRKQCDREHFNFMTVKGTDDIAYGRVNVINCWDEVMPLDPGKVTSEGGKRRLAIVEGRHRAAKDRGPRRAGDRPPSTSTTFRIRNSPTRAIPSSWPKPSRWPTT